MRRKWNLSAVYCPAVMAAELFFVYAWFLNLPGTESFFSVYCVYGVIGLCCILDNYNRRTTVDSRAAWKILGFSTAFSLSVILGNYPLFEPFYALMSLFNMGLCFAGGCVIGSNVLLWAMHHFPLALSTRERTRGKQLFWLTLAAVLVVDLVYLWFTNYPAVINYDTMSQLSQIMGQEVYSRWTPYWHTMTIRFFFNIGYGFTGDPNAALFVFELAQILFFGACFAYVLMTMYDLGIPDLFLGIAFFLYVLYPYNIVFNVTILKDVLFGGGLLLMLTALLRILAGKGKPASNYVVFALGSLGFSLWRTNGMYIYLVTALVVLPACKQRRKVLAVIMCSILAVSWFLNGPWLDSKQLEKAPFTETLAVPFQQIGRVIVNEREISLEDEAFLSEIFYLEEVKNCYRPESADPMKFEAYRYSSGDFLEENFGQFLKIWIRLGLRYPGDYLLAWIDETRGYWDGGYHMGVYDQGMPGNTLGMYNSGGDNLIARLFAAYFRYIEDPMILAPLKSIGFVVWVVLFSWWVNVLDGRKTWILSTPVLVLLAGLWLGTPVFAEFRYAYPVFLVSPLLMCSALFDLTEKTA